jgi:dCMP deaminase
MEYVPMKLENRISWEDYAMKMAETTALRSEDPYQKVGACVFDTENRIVGVGYNGLTHGKKVTPEFWSDRDERRKYMIHAEANALCHVDRNQGVVLACTLLPCSSCATLIAAYGIKKVLYKETYKRDMSSIKIFDFYGIECKQI